MAVCLENEFFIPEMSVEKVVEVCQASLREMKLHTIDENTDANGHTTILAGEGALVPLITKALLNPLGLDDFVKTAQRSGIHIVASPEDGGVHLILCGVALDETSGKLEDYSKEDFVEQLTDTVESLEFEKKFIAKIMRVFPGIRKIS